MSDTVAHPRRTPQCRRAIRVGLDRPALVTIDVDGREVTAHPGESLATALLAAGHTTGRTASGAPRAPYCNMGVCFDCVVTVNGQPYQRSCLVRVRPGLRVRTEPMP